MEDRRHWLGGLLTSFPPVCHNSCIGGRPHTQHSTMTNTNFTPAQAAAFKAANRAANANPQTIIITSAKPARKTQRQQWQEFRNETLGMIEAAKRERHFHLLPQLMQRLQTANTTLATIS